MEDLSLLGCGSSSAFLTKWTQSLLDSIPQLHPELVLKGAGCTAGQKLECGAGAEAWLIHSAGAGPLQELSLHLQVAAPPFWARQGHQCSADTSVSTLLYGLPHWQLLTS